MLTREEFKDYMSRLEKLMKIEEELESVLQKMNPLTGGDCDDPMDHGLLFDYRFLILGCLASHFSEEKRWLIGLWVYDSEFGKKFSDRTIRYVRGENVLSFDDLKDVDKIAGNLVPAKIIENIDDLYDNLTTKNND